MQRYTIGFARRLADIFGKFVVHHQRRAVDRQMRVHQAYPVVGGYPRQLGRAERLFIEVDRLARALVGDRDMRSEEHTSELQSLMRISYAVFCLKKKTQ